MTQLDRNSPTGWCSTTQLTQDLELQLVIKRKALKLEFQT